MKNNAENTKCYLVIHNKNISKKNYSHNSIYVKTQVKNYIPFDNSKRFGINPYLIRWHSGVLNLIEQKNY